MAKYLLIGGEADGEYFDWSDGIPPPFTFTFPLKVEVKIGKIHRGWQNKFFIAHEYRRTILEDGQRVWYVYLIADTPKSALEFLMEGYKK